MSARKFLDLLESQHLLDDAVISDLRRQVDESTRAVNAETIAKLLVDNGHLTKFQATKLVSDLGADKGAEEKKRSKRRSKKQAAKQEAPPAEPAPEQELGLAEDQDLLLDGATPMGDGLAPLDDDEGLAPLDGGLQPLDGGGGLQPLDGGGLQPLDAAQPAAQAAPQQPPAPAMQPLDSGGGLQPLGGGNDLKPLGGGSDLQPLGGGGDLQPLGGGGSLDPMDAGDAVGAAAKSEEKKERKGPKKLTTRDNIWDSPLLLVGGGVLLILLIVGTFLLLSLTRGTADDMLADADEDYRGLSFTQAINKYEKFLKSFPKNPKASFARVRIGMSTLKTSVAHATDPKKALATATEILPTIAEEEAFAEVRPEVATVLTTISGRFAERADNANTIASAEELLQQLDESLKLVYNGSYVTTTDRKTHQAQLDDIAELKEKVKREIGRDRSLANAVAEIRSAVNDDDTARAYEVRKTLLKQYPGLDTDPSLVTAVEEITERARGLVAVEPGGIQVETEDHGSDGTKRVLLAGNGGRPLAGADKRLALAKVDGAVYGVDAASGRVLWHRFVGYDTTIEPQPLSDEPDADALVADGSRHELLRLNNADGKVVWRLPIGEPFNTPVISADETRVIVSTQSGRVMELDMASGAPSATAKIPQELSVGPGRGDRRRPMIYQVADHDNVYVIENDTLECKQVYHLGHRTGTVRVPPVMEVGLVFVAVNSRPGVSMLYVLTGNDEGQELTEAQPPIPLEGHVVTPLMADNRRITIVTDLGQVNVLDIAPQKEDQAPVSAAVTPGVATHQQPTQSFSAIGELRLWVGDTRLTHYEIQTAKGELVKSEITNQGDAFVGPIQHLVRGGLLHLRKPKGSPGVTLRAVNPRAIEETIWFTELGVPAARIVQQDTKIFVISGRGRLYPISRDAVQKGFAVPTVPPAGDDVGHYYQHSQQLASGEMMLFNQQLDVLVFDPQSGQVQQRRMPGARGVVVAQPQAMGNGLLVPLNSGQVMFVGRNGETLAHPFQPKLEAGGVVNWRRPAVVGKDRFVIADGRRSLYLIGVNTRGAVHLGEIEKIGLREDIVSPLAAIGSAVWGVTRGGRGDQLVSYAADTLKPGKTVLLNGRATLGPVAVGEDLLIASTGDGLQCLSAEGEKRWQAPLPGPLAGPPTRDGDSYLLATVSGLLLRIDAASGQVQGQKQLNEPVHSSALAMGTRVLASGADGTLLVADLEPVSAEPTPSPEPAESTAATSP